MFMKMVSLFLGSILLVPVWLLSLFDGLLSVVKTVGECSGISEEHTCNFQNIHVCSCTLTMKSETFAMIKMITIITCL